AGDVRRIRRIPDAGRQARQRRRHDRGHHVAAENIRNAGKIAEHDESLTRVLEIARTYIRSRRERPVWPSASLEELRAALGGALPEDPMDPTEVVDALARSAEAGIVTTTGPRYFGFVTGGALPATVAAEWLTTVWDQPAGLFVLSPAASVVEEVTSAWLLDLLRLPATASVGFVTGCHMANFTALAAARHEMLRRAGWDVEADGACGMWASASPALRHHTQGVELADSWATDAHKWLNVPYDSGLVFVANSAAHRAAMSLTAAYLVRAPQEPREPMDWTPEASRRARGFAVYAALRSLGRQGVADLVDRCCRLARRFADRLRGEPMIQILNEVVLNQVLIRVVPASGDPDSATREALARVQEERICWLGVTHWHGMDAMRIS